MIKLRTGLLLISLLVCGCCLAQSTAQTQDDSVRKTVKTLASHPNDTSKVNKFLTAGSYFVNKPGSEAADMNAALLYGKQALDLAQKLGDPEATGKSFTVLSQIYREKGEAIQGMACIKKALVIFRQHEAPAAAAEAWFEQSNYYLTDPLLRERINAYQQGLHFLELSNPQPLKLAGSLKYIGELYTNIGDIPKGIAAMKRALNIFQKAGYQNLQDVYTSLGRVMMDINDMSSAVRYNLLAAKISEAKHDTSMTACQVYNNLAVLYLSLKDYPNFLIFLGKAKVIALKNKNIQAQYILELQTANYYLQVNRPGESLKVINEIKKLPGIAPNDTYLLIIKLGTYTDLKQFQTAGTYYDLLTPIIAHADLRSNTIQTAHVKTLEYLLATHQYARIQQQIPALSALTDVKNMLVFRYKIENIAFKADSATGNYISAIKHKDLAVAAELERTKSTYDKQIAGQQVQFEMAKKDQELAYKAANINLLTHENDLQKTALQDQQLIRNLFIAGLSLLALLLGLGYSRYKIKQRANAELESQQRSINEQNESLRQLLTEREWLLKEIHHRVKNNLQIIMSLMRTQLSHMKSDDAKEAFIESENRVQAIALIHQKLYNTQNFASIGMRTYVADLVSYLGDGLDTREKKVKFHQSVDPIQVDLAQAVPLGLILNEAITNAIKYGFNGNSADISITIHNSEGSYTVMTIRDKGKGLPDEFDVLTPKSLGMQMMKGLTRQLKGEFDIRSNDGVTVTVKFKLLPVFLPENNEKAAQLSK